MSDPADSQDSDLVGTVVDRRYQIQRLLGKGGMGQVYDAVHLRIGRRVAIKTLLPGLVTQPNLLERFHNEARAASTIGHDNIVDVLDMGELEDGSPYIVMERLDGRELGQLLKEEGPFTVGRAVRIMRAVCSGLGAAHEVGIVHRDLKPANLFLVDRRDGTQFPKILDFGISKFRTSADDQGLTETGIAVGTPAYMSPEQAEGLKTVDHRTDIYAVGVILYELVTCRKPFESDSYTGLLVKVMLGELAPPTTYRQDLPGAFNDVIMRAMARNPDERFGSTRELAAALEPFAGIDTPPLMAGQPSPNAQPSSTPPLAKSNSPLAFEETLAPEPDPLPPNKGTRAPVYAALGLAAVGIIGVASWALMSGGSDEEHPPDDTRTVGTTATVPDTPAAQDAAQGVAPSQADEEVHIRIRAVPSEAQIFVGEMRFPNPMDAMQPRSMSPATIRIVAEGYRTIERIVIFDSDQSLELEMASESSEHQAGRRGTRGEHAAPPNTTTTPAQPDPNPTGDMHREF